MKTTKYKYEKVIQQYYKGWGWEDNSTYETNSSFVADIETRKLLRHDLKEYSLTGYPTRVIKRKSLRND